VGILYESIQISKIKDFNYVGFLKSYIKGREFSGVATLIPSMAVR
jgi:hypothetical protein